MLKMDNEQKNELWLDQTEPNLAKANHSFEAKDLADKEKLEKKAKRLANIEKRIESRNKKEQQQQRKLLKSRKEHRLKLPRKYQQMLSRKDTYCSKEQT